MKGMKRNLLAFLVCLCAFCFCFGFVGCKDNGDPNSSNSGSGGNEAEITELVLSKTELYMDVYDEVTISLVTEVEGAVTWVSSATDIVSVADGKVTALKDGVATITVTWGDLQTTCKITVVNSYTAPVLKIDQENIGLEKGEELSFSAKVLWKGEDVSANATYTWALSEDSATNIVELKESADASTVTFKGVDYGEVEYSVTATYREVTVAKTIAVRVANLDVIFESDNLEMENGYFATSVAAVNIEQHTNRMTPQISVYDGDELSSEAIVWTSEDATVAEMVGGEIVGYKMGSTMLVGTALGNTVKIKVTVYRPAVKATEKVFLAKNASNYALKTQLQGNVESVVLGFDEIATSITDGKISYSADIFPTDYKTMGKTEVKIITDAVEYTFDAWIVTQAIYNETDLNSFMADNTVDGYVEGYFVLANDITCKSSYASVTANFKGIFDGLGHTIENFFVSRGTRGMFNIMELNSRAENILFKNAMIDGAVGGLFGYQFMGTLRNIFAEIVEFSTYSGGQYTGALFCCTHVFYGEMHNVLVDVTAVDEIGNTPTKLIDIIEGGNLDVQGYTASQHYFNAYIVGEKAEMKKKAIDVGAVCASYSELYELGVYNDTWDSEVWTSYNGVPYPKKLSAPQSDVLEETDLTVVQGKTVSVNAPNSYVQLSKEALALGVSAEGNLVSIPEDVASETVIFLEVYSIFEDRKVGEISITVLAKPTVEENPVYQTKIYAQDATGEYVLLSSSTQDGVVGETVSISNYIDAPTENLPLTQEYSGGYVFNAEKSNVSGEVLLDGSLVLTAYYDTVLRYKNIPSGNNSIVKNGNTYMMTDGWLYQSQPMYQMFGTFSDCAVITVEITVPVATILSERPAYALDRMVGILAGTATSASDGTLKYGTETAAAGHLRSVGFYPHSKGVGLSLNGLDFLYAADHPNSDLQHPLNKPVGGVVQSGWQPFAYSGDATNGYTVTDDTVELTVILYNNRFYIFVDDAFCTSKGFTDYAISPKTSGKTGTEFENGDKFVFGVWMAQTVGYDYTIKVTEEAYGGNATELLNNVELYATNVLGITNTAAVDAMVATASMPALPMASRKDYL